MALVSKPKGYVEPKPEGETSGRKTVDIFAADAPKGKVSRINPEEDAWQRIAPPPQGRYSLQLFPGDNPVTMNENAKGEFESYSISIMAKVVNAGEEFDGAICWPTVTTRIGRGKEISTAAGLIVKLGYEKTFKPGVEYSDLQIAKLLVTALKKEPIVVNNLCDWNASYQWIDPKGKKTYINVCNTMEDFPVDAEGNRDHIVKVTKRDGSRDEIQARFFVKEWGGKGSVATAEPTVVVQEEKPVEVKATPVKGKANGVAAVQPKKKEPEPEPEVQELEVDVDEEMILE